MPFATLFSNVAARLFGGAPAGGASGVEPELVQMAVEAVVEAVDPRLRTVSGYARKIAPGMASTITHMRTLARDMPAPILLSRGAWGSDPLLNAMFAAADDVPAALGRSEELRAFFESPANAALDEAHVLLGALKAERNVLAPAIVDGQLRQDVAQTTVNFSGHKVIAPGADFMACRREVGMRILKRLAELALARITAVGERATALEQRKALLGARLRMLNLRRGGLQDLAGGAHDEATEIASIERELKATVDDYVEAKASLATLESRIAHINGIFTAPADFVSYTRVALRVNRMGYKVAAGSDEQASDLTLGELSIGDGLKAVIVFVRCPRAELPARESLGARAARQGL
jgi:hypothetical protein